MSNNISKREKFHRDASLYFDNELVREIFYTDDFSICNIANQVYAVFFYPFSPEDIHDHEENGCVGVYLSSKFVRDIIRKPSKILKLFSLDKKTLRSFIFRLNEENFLIFKQIKEKNDLDGPSSEIDLDMEEELLNGGKIVKKRIWKKIKFKYERNLNNEW